MPALASSFLYQPLDALLGRTSHVRVLRVLTQHGGSLTPPDLARRAGLSRRGAWNAIAELQAAGVIEPVGAGRSPPYRLAENHPLSDAVRRLFEGEAARADAVVAAVREAARQLLPPPLAVWLYGSVTRGADTPASDLDIALVAEEDVLARAQAAQLRNDLVRVSERWAVAPSVISLSRSELKALQRERRPFWERLVRDAMPLVGAPAETLEYGD